MTSRLHRIFLIDGKTSGVVTSGMACELDPRGGAAITGSNGVGKTTSLQIIPLFMGCAPRRIVTAGSTKKPMIEFMLPHETSAIAFEYEREGSDELKMVVIRRQGTATPEYRFFNSGFREDLFIQPYGVGQMKLLDDAESVRAAGLLGIAVEGKLNTTEYRHVILRDKSLNKDASHINRLMLEYSFARRNLRQFEPLMAAIARDKVNFRDLKAVAVSMIYDAVGVASTGQKLVLKTMRTQIELWVKNRDACAKAFVLSPRMTKLRADIDALDAHRASMRSLRADVHALQLITAALKVRLEGEVEGLHAKRGLALREEQDTLATLNAALETQEVDARRLKEELEEMKGRQARFEREDVLLWVERVRELPQLLEQVAQVQQQVDLTKSTADGIVRKIEAELADLRQATAEHLGVMEAGKTAPNEAHGLALSRLGQREQAERLARTQEQRAAETAVQVDLDQAVQDAATANAQMGSMALSAEDQTKIDGVAQLLEQITAELETARRAHSVSRNTVHAEQIAVNEAGHTQRSSAVAARSAADALEAARREQAPKAGTLLAALHAHPDAGWRTGLSRVLDPALLARMDLKPSGPVQKTDPNAILDSDLAEDGSMFGWSLNLDQIAVPAWADAGLASQALSEKAAAAAAADSALKQADLDLDRLAKALKVSESKLAEHEAIVGIADRKKVEQTGAWRHAKDSAAVRLREAAEEARKACAKLEEVIKHKRAARDQLRQTHQATEQTHQALISAERAKLTADLAGALRSIDDQKTKFKAQREVAEAELNSERERRLKEGGVDVTLLERLEVNLKALRVQVRECEAHKSLVESWATWLKDEGALRCKQLADLHDKARQGVEGCHAAVKRHKAAMDVSKRDHGAKDAQFTSRMSTLANDVERLGLMDDRLVDFAPQMTSLVTAETPVSMVEGQVNNACKDQGTRFNEVTTNAQTLENMLVTGQGAVSDLVSGYVHHHGDGDRHGAVDRARLLCEAFGKIAEQIVAQLNRELSTILETLDAFRNRIATYKRAIDNFNKTLQAGIQGVVGTFDRLKGFEINVVSTFENKIAFLKQANELPRLLMENRETLYLTPRNELPKASTAEVLKAVMATLGTNGLEIDLEEYITLSGTTNDAGNLKPFHDEEGLQNLSSTGITALALITLLAGLMNIVRGSDDIYVPWASDEVGRFDAVNFALLMEMLKNNKIDVVTASPELSAAAYGHFAHRYLFKPESVWAVFKGSNQELEVINRARLEEAGEDLDEEAAEAEADAGPGLDRASPAIEETEPA